MAVGTAGREAELPTLVQQFQQSAVCKGQRVTIVTGSDANALSSSDMQENPMEFAVIPGATVTVDYADIVDGSRIKAVSPFVSHYQTWFGPKGGRGSTRTTARAPAP
jgi:hypothetical protein